MLKDSRDNYVTFAPLLSDAGYTAPYFRDIHCQTPARLLGTPVPPQCVFQLLSVEYGGALEAVRDRSLGICAESLRLHVHSPMSPQLQLLVWQDVPACPPGGSEASAAKYPVDYDANVRVAVWRGNILNLCADVLVCPSDGKIFSPWRRPLASQVLAMSEHDKQLKRCASIPALGRASHCRSSYGFVSSVFGCASELLCGVELFIRQGSACVKVQRHCVLPRPSGETEHDVQAVPRACKDTRRSGTSPAVCVLECAGHGCE